MFSMKFLVLLFVVSCALALPRPPHHHRRLQQSAAARLRRAPAAAAARHRTMLISGYYRPLFAQRRQGYEPETAMTAFAAGENVAAGSYLGTGACATCGERDPELLAAEEPQLDGELPFEQDPAEPAAPADTAYPVADYVGEAEAPAPAPVAALAPLKPLRTPKVKPAKKVQKQESEESDDADEEAYVPSKARHPSHSYFPIVFSGYPGGAARSGAAAGGAGGVTAIANSYSTGKGGVANSHATAYGAAAPSRSRKRAQAAEEDSDDE